MIPAATAPPVADGATVTVASAAGADVVVNMDSGASIAADDANASGASGADADMAVGMATDVTADR